MLGSLIVAPSWLLAAVFVGAVALALVVRNIYLVNRSGLRQFPSPSIAKWTDLWRLWYSYHNQHGKPMVDLHAQHGEAVRLGPSMLSWSSPEAVKDIYGPGKNFRKSEYYSVIATIADGVLKQTLFSTRDQNYHNKYRKAVNSAFSMSAVLKYEPYVDEITSLFLERLDQQVQHVQKAGAGWIDLPRLLQHYAFDAVGMIAYSRRYGFVEKDEDIDGIIGNTRFILDYTSHMGNYPLLDKLVIKNPIMMYLARIGIVNMTTPLVPFSIKSQAAKKAEYEKDPDRKNMQNDLLEAYFHVHNEKPDVITQDEITELGIMLGFAGSESTSVALSALVYHVSRNPSVAARLRQEMDAKLNKNSAHVSYAEASQLPYFDACVKEAFRIHPPSGFIMERVVPDYGAVIGGKAVPGGTIVGCNPWAVHRHQSTFGVDTETYRPERWLDEASGGHAASDEEVKNMWKAMIHFGSGPHTCMGKNISVMEVYKLGATLLKTFDIELERPYEECPLDVGQFVRMNFGVRLHKRIV